MPEAVSLGNFCFFPSNEQIYLSFHNSVWKNSSSKQIYKIRTFTVFSFFLIYLSFLTKVPPSFNSLVSIHSKNQWVLFNLTHFLSTPYTLKSLLYFLWPLISISFYGFSYIKLFIDYDKFQTFLLCKSTFSYNK